MVRKTRSRASPGGDAKEGKRSTRSKGAAELEEGLAANSPRKKARVEEDEDDEEEDISGREESGEEEAEEPSEEEPAADEEVDDEDADDEEADDEEVDDEEADDEEADDEEADDEEADDEEADDEEADDEEADDEEAGEKESPKKNPPSEKPASTSASSSVCIICNKEDDRPMCHFLPNPEGNGEEVHVHNFCGKIAAISSHNKMPQYEIVDLAAIRNKYGKTFAVTAAMQKTRSVTSEKDGKTFYLFKEFENALSQEHLDSSSPPPQKRARGRPKGSGNKTPTTKQPNKTPVKPRTNPQGYTLVHSGGVVPAPLLPKPSPLAPTPRKEDLDIRRRPCVCDNPSCYTVLERWVQVGDDMRCGYVSLPNWSTKKTDRSKVVNQFRELVFVNLKGDKKLAQKDRNVRKYVAFHHFELFMLLPGNKGLVEYIEPEVAKSIRLDGRYRIAAGENEGKYLPSPRRAFSDIMKELERIEKKKKVFPSHRMPQAFPVQAPPPPPVVDQTTYLESIDIHRLQTRLNSLPKTYDAIKSHAEQTEKALAFELKRKRDLEMDLANTRRELNRVQTSYGRLRRMVKELGDEADTL